MGIHHAAITVGTSASPIAIPETDITTGHTVWLHNHDHQNSHEIYVGDASVSASTGFHLRDTQTLGPISLAKGEQLYAISNQAGGVLLHVLATGV